MTRQQLIDRIKSTTPSAQERKTTMIGRLWRRSWTLQQVLEELEQEGPYSQKLLDGYNEVISEGLPS